MAYAAALALRASFIAITPAELQAGLSDFCEVLPTPIAIYIAAENSGHPEALAECFAEDTVVRDEGQTIEGLVAIKQWKAKTKKKSQHMIEPLASTRKDGKAIVTNRLTGNFPGSPIELEFDFTLDGDKIASLEIRS
jgi:SnoaL-like domain